MITLQLMNLTQQSETMALHEAVHFVVGRVCGFPSSGVIAQTADDPSQSVYVAKLTQGDTCGSFYYELLTAAAAKSAECLWKAPIEPDAYSTDSGDVAAMTNLIVCILGAASSADRKTRLGEVLTCLNHLWDEASKLIATPEHIAAIEALLARLKEIDSLSELEAEEIVKPHLLESEQGLEEPHFPMPVWYVALAGRSEEDLIQLRKVDFENIWRFHRGEGIKTLPSSCGSGDEFLDSSQKNL